MAQTPRKKRTPTETQRRKFLLALANGWSVSKGAKAAGVPRRTVYNWRDDDEIFAADWDHAIEQGTDALEDEAIRRGFKGSDTLLIFTLKARRPEKFKDRSHVDVDLLGGLAARMEAAAKRPKEAK